MYTGLTDCQLYLKSFYFVSHVSASISQNGAKKFVKYNNGMILELNSNIYNNPFIISSDISWISKYTDEREVLICRNPFCVKGNCILNGILHQDKNKKPYLNKKYNNVVFYPIKSNFLLLWITQNLY